MLRIRSLVPVVLLALAPLATALRQESGEVFDKVVEVLDRWYFDKEFREQTLPVIAAELRERAHAAATPAEERAIVGELLAQIPSSHLALISEESYRHVGAELLSKDVPSFGLQLIHLKGRYHATWIFEGGPADLAGVKRGDEVLTIDGVAPGQSPRLDWSTDDAALPDAQIHSLHAAQDDSIQLSLRRKENEVLTLKLEAVPYSGAKAARASARVIEREGKKLGYVHFWYIQFKGPTALLKELFAGEFKDCDGLILDLRGRGGAASEVSRVLKLLSPETGAWKRPLVALTDHGTRSAKEVIALKIKTDKIGQLVGERTAGAVIPAAFKKVGGGAVLMFPFMTMGSYTEKIEGIGVSPHVKVADALAYTAGADPILAAGIEVLVQSCKATPQD